MRPRKGFALPAFLAEIEGPAYRSRLEFSVRSGLSIVLVFALWGVASGAIPPDMFFYWPVGLKIASNTAAWIGLRTNRLVLLTASVNVAVDVFAMTWAIYVTGGAQSPLFCIYAIELTVVALLSNLGTTVLIAIGALVFYTSMIALVYFGIAPAMPPPAVTQADLTPRYLTAHVMLSIFALGVPTLFTAAILSKLREKQRELEERTQALVDASKERAQFMANITHELRTPIHGIRGLSELVTCGVYGPVADERQRRAHDEIKRSAESMLGLVDDLLALARHDAGRASFDPCDVDANDLCDRLIATTRGLIGRRTLELVSDVADRLPRLYTDRSKLTQIILNLLANAVKFTPDEGRITFRARRSESGEGVVFEVTDTGRGMRDEDLERIFEPFVQVDGGTEREHGGVGLGLTLVKRLCELLGARVEVTSVLGRGTTFVLYVPTSPAVVEAAAPASLMTELA